MKDEFGRPFGKKEFLETFIVAIVTLFLVCVSFIIPTLFPFILLTLVIFFVIALIDYYYKKKKKNK
jgi:uncharacterized membrane protein YesL